MITTTYKEQFHNDGFLVIEDFNTAEECDALMQKGEELANNFNFDGHPSVFQTTDQAKSTDDYFLNSGDRISFFFEKDAFNSNGKLKNGLFQSLNKVGHALHDVDPEFDKFSRSPQMKKLVKTLEFDDYLIIQSMLIFKHAKIGGLVDIHQDATFLYTEPASCIGFWFALEDATKNNGCLWAKPSGHREPLRYWFRRKESSGTEMIKLNDEPFSIEGMIPLEVKKGACIVLDGFLPHYSLPNTSGKSRQAYAIHCIDPSADYSSLNWLQRDMKAVRGFA